MTDSPALHPLHSAVANRFAGYADAIASFRRSQTGETVGNESCAPKDTRGRDAPHIGQDTALRREASPVAEDTSNSTARLRPVQDHDINREHGQLPVAPQAALPNLADLTDQTRLV
jgi:hypothetical protein